MLISDKLKSFDFTYAEKEIVKYFLNQKEEIARQSTREISKRLYCSPSSIIRLCQKLGFTGFEEFKEMGKTILFVSHDLSSIGKYCDRVVLLNKGEKLAEGDAKEMVNLYRRVLVNQYDEPGENNDTKETQEKGTAVQEEKSMKEQLNLNPKVLEYGSKLAEIQDFAIREKSGMITNVIEKGEEFSVDMKIHFHETIQEPIFAFTIKDLKGTEITGTNTMFEKMHIEHSDEGDTCTVTFTQKMFLQGGEYLLAFGCTGYKDGEFTVFHRLYDACNITVISTQNTVGFYDMNSKVTIRKVEKGEQ